MCVGMRFKTFVVVCNIIMFVPFRVSEQRRKRLQELEQEMSQLKHKMSEQIKMLKMKEQTDKQVLHLNSEIQVC